MVQYTERRKSRPISYHHSREYCTSSARTHLGLGTYGSGSGVGSGHVEYSIVQNNRVEYMNSRMQESRSLF